jgi:hypothetical protein
MARDKCSPRSVCSSRKTADAVQRMHVSTSFQSGSTNTTHTSPAIAHSVCVHAALDIASATRHNSHTGEPLHLQLDLPASLMLRWLLLLLRCCCCCCCCCPSSHLYGLDPKADYSKISAAAAASPPHLDVLDLEALHVQVDALPHTLLTAKTKGMPAACPLPHLDVLDLEALHV